MAKAFASFLLSGALAAGLILTALPVLASTTSEVTSPSIAATATIQLAAPRAKGVGGVQLAYGCDSGQCTCHGDTDCNDMYSGGACKTNGSCQTGGGVTCTCATHAMVHSPGTGTGTGTGTGKGIIKKPPISSITKKQ